MKKVLTIGGATQDIFISHEQVQMLHLSLKDGKRSFLIYEAGRKVEIDDLTYHTGGGATNAAASFKKLNFDVRTFCKVGTDQEGTFIIDALKAHDINTQYVIQDAAELTSRSFIIPTEAGDRVALVYRGVSLTLKADELPPEAYNKADQLYITSLCGNASQALLPIVRQAKKSGCRVAVNPGTSQLVKDVKTLCKSLNHIDILILNSLEARHCMAAMVQAERSLQLKVLESMIDGQQDKKIPKLLRTSLTHRGLCFSLRFFFKEILERGPQIIVVTNGKEGVYVGMKDHILFHPIVKVPVVSTLGAGDAFGSTFVGWLLHDHPVEDALRAGIINSASVIGEIGAKVGLLPYKILQNRVQKLDTNLLQEFELSD